MTINIALCDDDRETHIILLKNLDRFFEEIESEFMFTSFHTAEELLEAPFNYDVLFLDIMLNNDNDGINIGKELRKKGNTALFLLFTSRTDRYLDGYSANVFRYLVKPVFYLQLKDVMMDSIEELRKTQEKFVFEYDNEKKIINTDEIVYIEPVSLSSGTYRIATESKTYLTSMNWQEIQNQLTSRLTQDFFLVDKFNIINFNFVESNTKKAIVLVGDCKVSINKDKYMEFNRAFSKYLSN